MGEIYNRIEILDVVKTIKSGYETLKYVKCKCHCGNIFVSSYKAIKYGYTKSCGCARLAKICKHKKSKHPLYGIWQHMKYRCNTPSCKYYHNYGARGIKVCDEWLGEHGFDNFYEWSMHNGYAPGLSIDRIDNDGPYAPWNCRWVGMGVQQNNKRTNTRIVDLDGTEYTYSQFERRYNLETGWLDRKFKRNWSLDAILYAAHHLEYGIHRSYRGNRYLDADGFEILIPTIELQKRDCNLRSIYKI